MVRTSHRFSRDNGNDDRQQLESCGQLRCNDCAAPLEKPGDIEPGNQQKGTGQTQADGSGPLQRLHEYFWARILLHRS